MVDERAMSEQQAEQGGFNNVLASAVGAADLNPAVSGLAMERGDVLLLCTDGLTKHVSEAQIAAVLARTSDPEAAVRELVALALADGGRDNVTVVVVHTLTA
jgi:protein phosphatase